MFFQKDFIFYSRLHRAACEILVLDQGLNPCLLHWEHGTLTPGSPGRSLKLFIGEYGHVTPQLKTSQGLSEALRMKSKVITGIHVAQKDPIAPHSNLTSLLFAAPATVISAAQAVSSLWPSYPMFFLPGRQGKLRSS